jgi:hypothetical protein
MAIELAIRKAAPKMSRKDAMQVIQGMYSTVLLCIDVYVHQRLNVVSFESLYYDLPIIDILILATSLNKSCD